MISDKQTFVCDIDGTLCTIKSEHEEYNDVLPLQDTIDVINMLYNNNCHIILFTARGMRTYNGDINKINENVKPVLEEWLKKNNVLYHELIMGKPWGPSVNYIDDRAIRPDELVRYFDIKGENNL